ncbi:TPA: hypothetical protein ACF3KM_005404, partial [Klebsiella quasipneumoniae subsp. quasipneumoniae]
MSIKNDGHYFCRAGGNRPDGLNEPVTLASRFGRYNSIRRERPLTDDELMQFVPSVFSGDKHESRSERYT